MLAIATQADAFAQVIHVQQVIFPLLIEHAQHDHALVITHCIRTDQLFFRVITLSQLFEDRVPKFLPIQGLRLHAFGQDVHAESREDRVLQALDVPVLRMDFFCRILIHLLRKNVGNVVFEDQVFLIQPSSNCRRKP